MGILGFLGQLFCGKAEWSNPTKHWMKDPSMALVLNLDDHSLCGQKCGDTLGRLKGLGPLPDSEKRSISEESYDFSDQGLMINCLKDSITDFDLCFDQKMGVFTGEICFQGHLIGLTPKTSKDDFLDIFGEPFWIDQEGEETVLFYAFGEELEWQVEFVNERLNSFTVTADPELADETLRKVYKVDKPWPPKEA